MTCSWRYNLFIILKTHTKNWNWKLFSSKYSICCASGKIKKVICLNMQNILDQIKNVDPKNVFIRDILQQCRSRGKNNKRQRQQRKVSPTAQSLYSVYFLAEPCTLLAGYLRRFRAILRSTAWGRSTRHFSDSSSR